MKIHSSEGVFGIRSHASGLSFTSSFKFPVSLSMKKKNYPFVEEFQFHSPVFVIQVSRV